MRGAVRVDGEGQPGVRVTLSGSTIRTVTTDAAGAYAFATVPAGSYQVDIDDVPADASFPITRQPAVITTAGQQVVLDFVGEVLATASVFGTVTADDEPLPGVPLRLTGGAAGDSSTAQTVTNAQGAYTFAGLRAGIYVVTMLSSPAGVVFSDTVQSVTVAAGEGAEVHFSGSPASTGRIMGTVRRGSDPLAGVTVRLLGAATRTTQTDGDGQYRFAELATGAYQVEIADYPADALFLTTRLPAVLADAGQQLVVDFAGQVARTASIAGAVSLDGEPLPGVALRLSGGVAGDTSSAQDTTDAQGRFAFPGLRAGDYVVTLLTRPAGVRFADTVRSVTLAVGQDAEVQFVGTASATAVIVGTVRQDTTPLAGITVTLSGAAARETQTNERGDYTFGGLPAGDYAVAISGFPTAVAFDPVRREVTLDAGQSARLDFTAGAPEPATIRISGLTAVSGGAAVDPLNVSGSFSVRVAVDPGDQTLERLEVRLADGVAAMYVFSGAAPTVPFTSALAVHSAAFDDSTGTPQYLNGAKTLAATVRTTAGGAASDTLSMPVVLRNADVLRGQVSSTAQATDSAGRLWRGGNVTVSLIPTLYSGLTLATTDARFFSARSDANPARFNRRDIGEVNSSATPEENLVVETVLSNGEPGPVFRAAVRYESVPPLASGPFRLSDPGYAYPRTGTERFTACCRGNWVEPDYRWDTESGRLFPTDSWDGTPGVGGQITTFHAGPVGESLEQLARRPSAETPREAGLRQSMTNGAYQVVARVADALGNERLIPLTTGFAGAPPLTFGVDATPPLDQMVIAAQTTLVDRAIYSPALRTTLSANPMVTFTARDPESGLSAQPLGVRFEIRNAVQPPGTLCPFGDCVNPTFLPLSQSLPAQYGDGYHIFRGEVYNQAGLGSGTVVQSTFLLDGAPPSVQAPAVPSRLRLGESLRIPVSATDNVDLLEFDLAAEFAVPAGLPTVYPLTRATPVGDPWTDRLTTTLSRTGDSIARSVVALERVNGSGRVPGSGALAPITAMQLRVRDVARNTGVGRTALNPLNQPRGTSFLETPMFAEGEGTFQVRVDQPFMTGLTVRLCIHDDRPCPAGARRAAPIFAVVEWTGLNPVSGEPNPFSGSVLFYLRDNLGDAGGEGALRMLPGGVLVQHPSQVIGPETRRRWWRVELKGSDLLHSGWAHEQYVPVYAAGLNADTGTLLLSQPITNGIILVDNQ